MIRTILCSCLAAACISLLPSAVTISSAGVQCGQASWYSLPGKPTASGQIMNPAELTAAHRTLPFGTKLQVVNNSNGKQVTVKINDRGPFVGGRVIDVSRAAASRLGFVNRGHTKVCFRKVS